MKLALVLNPKNSRWLFHKDSTLQNKFHYEIPNTANVLDSADLSENKEAWIEPMYNMVFLDGTIDGVMTCYFNKKGWQG